MLKRRRTKLLTSDRYSTQQEIQTPELPQIMRQSRPRTRSQTTPQSESDPLSQPESDSLIEQQCSSQPQSHSHAEQKDYAHSQGSRHVETQLEAPTGPQIDGSAKLHPCPEHPGQIQAEELSDGLHNYIEGQDGAPTKSQQEFPGKLQVAPVDLEHTPQYLRKVKYHGSSSTMTILGSSLESKGTRGTNRLSRIWNLPEGYKVGVQFDSNFQPIKREGGLLKRFLGTAARKSHLLPIHFKTWLKVPYVYKQGLWDLIKSKFEIPLAHEREIEKVILQKMGYMWRGYKCHLKAHYFDENKSLEEMIANVPPRVDKEQWASLVALWNTSDMKTLCQNNKALRQHQKIRHTTGTKSFAEIAEEMKEKDGVAPTEEELFILTHRRKDGTALNEDSAKKIAEMEKLLAQRQENSQSSNEDIGSQDDADADADGGDDDDDDDDVDGGDDPDYDDINSQVMEKETNDHVRSLRLGNTPARNTSYLSPTVVSARIGSDARKVDIETMRGSDDSRQVEKDRVRVVKDRGRPRKNGKGKEVIDESANFVRGSSTRSRNTSRFSPIVAIARMVCEDNMREVVGERMIAQDSRQVVKDKIRVEEDRRRAEEMREKERSDYKQSLSVGIIPLSARRIPEKDTRQADEEMIRAYEKERKQVEEDRKRVEEDRRRVEEDRRQVEEDRRQAQEVRMQAEEERRKAEEERKKSDAEIRFLKERLTWMENLVSKLLPSTNSTNNS